MGLLLDGDDAAVKVEGVKQVGLAQPDADHLVITLIDDSGHPIAGFEKVVFIRGGRGIEPLENRTPFFSCWSSSVSFGWGRRYRETGMTEMSIMMGRLPDGSLAVRTHAYMFSSSFFFVDQQWHRYEETSSRELSP
jgi:hypothetical protein